MDSTTILAIAIASLSAVLIAVGIYAIIILREVHRTLRRVSNIISRVDSVTEAIDSQLVRPGSNLVGILSLLKEGATILSELRQTSNSIATSSQIVGAEVKKATKAVRETAPVVAHQAKEVIDEAAGEAHDLADRVIPDRPFFMSDAPSSTHANHADEPAPASKETDHEKSSAKQPEPMKAQSLASRRRFFTRR